jgi:hypothetical protein
MALNALADVATINAAAAYLNAHGKVVRPELFYDKILLDTIRLGKEHYVYHGLAEVRPIQGKAEKLILRRWSPLAAHTIPLSEGIPPKSDKGAAESWELGTFQYGRYMEFTDKVDFEMIDPIISHFTQQYSIVAVETLDLLAREALFAVPNKYYAGAVTGMIEMEIGADFVPSLADLRIIALGMKKRLVKPRSGANFEVIASPDFFYDMVVDPIVEKFFTINQTTKDTYNTTMIPAMFNLTWKETQAYEDDSTFNHVYPNAALTKAARLYRMNAGGTAFEYATVYEKADTGVATGFLHTDTDVYTGDPRRFPDKELNAIPSLTFWDLDAYNADNQGVGDPWMLLKVLKVLVVGANCLIRTELEGEGNAKMYVKGKGSAGVLDPIDQRQSIGFKINSVGYGVERLDAVAIYHCVPTQSNI